MFYTAEWQIQKKRFIGGSLAGVGTSVGALDFDVCFDVANGPRHTLKFTHFLMTHAHSDHASGIPYVVSQKAMASHKTPKFYLPEETVPGLERIMKEWQTLEDYEMPFQLIPISPNQSFQIDDNIRVQAFRTVHRVPSLGYTIYTKKKKLKSEFVGKHPEEIVQLKKQGVVTDEIIEIPELSFTGDTQIDVLERHPELLDSRLLFFEVTYYDEAKSVADTKKWGHTHFAEIVPYIEKFRGEKLVLMHHSARYRMRQLGDIVRRGAGEFFDKIFIAPSLYS